MSKRPGIKDATARQFIADRIKRAREGRCSQERLAEQTGLALATLRRIENATTSVDAIMLSDIATTLDRDITWFLPRRPKFTEHVEHLWQKHGLDSTGGKNMRTKIGLLMDKELWEPPEQTEAQTRYAMAGSGFEEALPGRIELHKILENLPADTKVVSIMAGSGENNIGGNALKRLIELAQKNTRVRLLALNPDSAFTEMRALEDTRWGNGDIVAQRIRSVLTKVKNAVTDATPAPNFDIRTHDRWMNWRLTFIDDRVYASHYPPNGDADRVPVRVFKADNQQSSLFWPLLKEFADTWHYGQHRDKDAETPAPTITAVHEEFRVEVQALLDAQASQTS